MNRIQYLLDDDADLEPFPAAPVAPSVLAPADGENPHCIFTPQHYERNYAYPLVVWLHGPDDDERQVNRVMPLVSLRNYVAVGPRGTHASQVPGGFRWSQDADAIALADQRVQRSVAAVRRRLHIAPGRIYLAGYECGGTMALRLALHRPKAYAGVLSIGGALPEGLQPFRRLHELRNLNVFLATGRYSQQYSERKVCRNLRLMHAAGMSLNLRQYPCGDEVTTEMLSDMDRWIMEQVAATCPAAQDQPSHRH